MRRFCLYTNKDGLNSIELCYLGVFLYESVGLCIYIYISLQRSGWLHFLPVNDIFCEFLCQFL